MHWAEAAAAKVISRKPDHDEYVCAAGTSPSGSVHIGNFRDLATAYFVYKAFLKRGKKARLLFSWDDMDRLRKIPVNVKDVNSYMEQYIGRTYADTPDPFVYRPEFGPACESYAKRFEIEYEAAIEKFGIRPDFRYQQEMYRSGAYRDAVIHSLRHRLEIDDILDELRTTKHTPEERESYYPVSIYCPDCRTDYTTITDLSEDCTKAHYNCRCGYEGDFDFETNFDCKLAWKIDWPMRWRHEGVVFEPGGKDHAAPTSSYSAGKVISKKIFGYTAPDFVAYEFIGIKGSTGKMSGSSGLNLTPETLLKLYQPEIILWLYSKNEPNKAFDFCFDDGIIAHYQQFDRMLTAVRDGKANEAMQDTMYYCHIDGREVVTVPMDLLVTFGNITGFNPELIEMLFKKVGMDYTREDFAERLELAKNWSEQCSPDSLTTPLEKPNWAYYSPLPDSEKRELKLLSDYLSAGGYAMDELLAYLYEIPKIVHPEESANELKTVQGTFFKNAYNLLIGKDQGPRLYLLLYAFDPEVFLPLFDFSGEPPTELDAPADEQAAPEPAVLELAPEIDLDTFRNADMRVCEVRACEEIPDTRFLKLTVFDGARERTIMSTVREYYKPEELMGRKIIVLANLKTARLRGVDSEGMLLAASTQHDCAVVFVRDDVPSGTRIS